MRDLVGQRFNGYQLHRSLRALGHDSSMLVVHRRSDDPSVRGHPAPLRILERGLYGLERVSSLQGLLSPLALSFPFRHIFRSADVVHWHLVYPHFVSLPLMPWLSRMRPTVWTLHDPWAMTGHCVHPLECQRWRTGCGRCPDLATNFTVWFDTTALVWRAKRAVYHRSPLTLIVASRWMKEQVAASPLLSSFPCHLIPFGLDLNTWRLRDRAGCRAALGIPSEAHVLALRAPPGRKHEHTKGIPWLTRALERLNPTRPTFLLVFDARGTLASLGEKYRIVELGWLHDESRVAEALTAADAFLMPSAAESFGMMALEAMACGTAVIGSSATAVADTIHAPEAGLTVPAGDDAALAAAIARLLEDDRLRDALGRRGRAIVESEHSFDDYVRRHVELYEALARRGAQAV